ncbi:MAG: hypothetical protein AB9903_13580 [Vulcanimicrobiota bacterium]
MTDKNEIDGQGGDTVLEHFTIQEHLLLEIWTDEKALLNGQDQQTDTGTAHRESNFSGE